MVSVSDVELNDLDKLQGDDDDNDDDNGYDSDHDSAVRALLTPQTHTERKEVATATGILLEVSISPSPCSSTF